VELAGDGGALAGHGFSMGALEPARTLLELRGADGLDGCADASGACLIHPESSVRWAVTEQLRP